MRKSSTPWLSGPRRFPEVILLVFACGAPHETGQASLRTAHHRPVAAVSPQSLDVVQTGSVTPDSWDTYFGAHYSWQPWAQGLRDPGLAALSVLINPVNRG